MCVTAGLGWRCRKERSSASGLLQGSAVFQGVAAAGHWSGRVVKFADGAALEGEGRGWWMPGPGAPVSDFFSWLPAPVVANGFPFREHDSGDHTLRARDLCHQWCT